MTEQILDTPMYARGAEIEEQDLMLYPCHIRAYTKYGKLVCQETIQMHGQLYQVVKPPHCDSRIVVLRWCGWCWHEVDKDTLLQKIDNLIAALSV